MAKSNVEVTKARGLYLGYYMAYGAFLPFINLYYQRIGFTGTQIGILSAAPVLVASVGSLVWAMIADAFHIRDRILSLALLLTPIPILFMTRTTSFPYLLLLSLIFAALFSPVGAILDGSAVEKVKAYRVSFGSLRVWGSIGWTLSSWLVGLAIERWEIRAFFYLASGLMLLTLLISLYGPATAPSQTNSLPKKNIRGFFTLEIGIFLTSVMLISISSGAGGAFTSIYLSAIGAKEGTVGLGWAFSSLSEIPMMFISGYLLLRLGTLRILRIALLLYSLKWVLFSIIHVPALALLVQLLGGASFAILLVAGVTYISSLAPEGMGVTAQAIFSTTYYSIGAIIGGLLGGYLYDTLGLDGLFRLMSVVALAGFLLFSIGTSLRLRPALERN